MWFQRISRVEAVAITVMGFVLAAVLFPVFVIRPLPPHGRVQGVNGVALPHTALRFSSSDTGRDIEIVTDEKGNFAQAGLSKLARLSTNGFVLTRYLHSTGGRGTYVFSQRGTQVFTFTDTLGKPVRGKSFLFTPNQRTYQPFRLSYFDRTTDENGTVTLTRVPMAAGYLIHSNDMHWKIKTVGPAQGAPDARYAQVPVTVAPSK